MKELPTKLQARIDQIITTLVIAKATGNQNKEVKSLEHLAFAYWQADRPLKVIKFAQQGLAILQGTGNVESARKLFNYIAHALIRADRMEEALPYLKAHLSLALDSGDPYIEAQSAANLGRYYLDLDLPQAAIRLHRIFRCSL